MCLYIVLARASYVFESLQVFAFMGQNMKLTVKMHSVVYLHCGCFYNDTSLVCKFRNGKRCRRKLEKQNIRLKPEMTGYLCFSSLRILRLPRYSLAFGFLWTLPSVHINEITVLLIWHGCKQYFDSEIRKIDKAFFPSALLVKKSNMQISYEMVSDAHVHQVSVSF